MQYKLLIPALITLAMLPCTQGQLPDQSFPTIPHPMDLQGHRGARGLFPESTLTGFQSAVELGMTTLEWDLHSTRDGHFVVFHDNELTQHNQLGADPSWIGVSVEQRSLAEMRSLDVGSIKNPRFPEQGLLPPTAPLELGALLDALSEKAETDPRFSEVRFNIELKFSSKNPDPETLQVLAKRLAGILLDKGAIPRTTIQSFHIPFVAEVKKRYPGVETSALFEPSKWDETQLKIGLPANSKEILKTTIAIGADILSPYYLYATPAFVAQCHAEGIRIIPWTVNDVADMQRLMDAGIDGIISDYPDRLQKTHAEWLSKRSAQSHDQE